MTRLKSVPRKAVFDLLLDIQSRLATITDVESQIAMLHHMDGLVNRFIYEDDPLAAGGSGK